jgi:hypothetical protein
MIKKGLNKALAEVGKIKTGFRGAKIVSKGGAEFAPPKKFDHFVITTTERDAKTGNLIEDGTLMAKLGGKPRELKIRLPFDSVDKNFFTQFQAYSGGKKLCAGDGEKAMRRGEVTVAGAGPAAKLVAKGEDLHEVACDYETCPIAVAGKCKVSGILSAFLPESGDLGGVYKYRTHSWNGVSSILGSLEYFAEQTGGILQGMPLKLVLVKKTTEEHGTIDYATIVIDGEEIFGLRRKALAERKSRLQIGYDITSAEAAAVRAGFLDDHDLEEDVEAEFYPAGGGEDDKPKVVAQKGTSAEDVAAKLAAQKPAAEPAVPPAAAPQSVAQGSAPAAPAKGKDTLDIF